MLELTYSWDTKRYDHGNAYGHVAYQVDSIEEVQKRLETRGYNLSWGRERLPMIVEGLLL